MLVSIPTGSKKSLCYCLLQIFSILQQVDDTTHKTHTRSHLKRSISATNCVTELTARVHFVQQKSGKTLLQAQQLVKGQARKASVDGFMYKTFLPRHSEFLA